MNHATKIELLKAARVLIAVGDNQFICLALLDASRGLGRPWTTKLHANELQCWITDALGVSEHHGGNSTLGNWLTDSKRLPTSRDRFNDYIYRVEWIDWMIATLSGHDATAARLAKSGNFPVSPIPFDEEQ